MHISYRYSMKVLHTQGVMKPYPALEGSKSASAGGALRQRLLQRLGLLEIRRVKPLGEPRVHRRQQVVGLLALPLGLPQAGQAGGGAQLPGAGLLLARDGQGLLE